MNMNLFLCIALDNQASFICRKLMPVEVLHHLYQIVSDRPNTIDSIDIAVTRFGR